VKELLLELVGPARLEEGCLYYDVSQQSDQPDTFYIIDGWASEEAVAVHAAHPNVSRVVGQLLPLLGSPLEVITSNRVSEPAAYRKMIQNLVWATAYNLVAIPVAAGVFVRWGLDLPMSVGAVAMSLSTIIVAANAQLLRRLKLQPPAV
jgi:quinol monooxygenase YgiN